MAPVFLEVLAMLGVFLKSPQKRLVAAILFGALLAGGLGMFLLQT